MAITDHDTLTGVPDALAAGKRHGVEVVPGVEISSYGYGRQMDILCYFIEPDCAAMNDLIEWAQRKRSERNPEIARRIAAQGVPLDLSDVEKLAGGGQVGRPHFARALIDVGAVKDVREAFERFLGPGAIAYVPKARVEPERVISVVREAGGVSVLAHPVQLEMETDEELRGLVESLSAAGLGGIEAHYPSHSESQTELYRTLAGEFNLAVTGGSDFHGETKPTIHLGESARIAASIRPAGRPAQPPARHAGRLTIPRTRH